MKPSKLGALALLLVALARPISAQVVFDNGVPNNANGFPVSSPGTIADDFVLGSTTQLGVFNWWVYILAGSVPATITAAYDFDVRANTGGSPGAILQSFSVTSNLGTLSPYTLSGFAPGYSLSASFGGLTLGPGTYWLSVSNYSDNISTEGYWATSSSSGGNGEEATGAGPFDAAGAEFAFNLTGTPPSAVAPEPGTVWLLAAGLVGLAGAGMKKRRRVA
jgi:hypothetical protein